MKILLSILFTLTVINMTGQIRIQNISLTKPDTNILYIDKGNKIDILGINRLDYKLLTTNSKIDTAGGQITIYPNINAPNDTLKVISHKKIVAQKIYEIKRFPEVDFLISGSRDSIISKELLLTVPNLTAYLPNCLFKYPFSIVSFEIDVHRKIIPDMRYSSTSNRFTEGMIEEIKRLKTGDMLTFDNIKCTCPDCRIRSLGGRTIRIK